MLLILLTVNFFAWIGDKFEQECNRVGGIKIETRNRHICYRNSHDPKILYWKLRVK